MNEHRIVDRHMICWQLGWAFEQVDKGMNPYQTFAKCKCTIILEMLQSLGYVYFCEIPKFREGQEYWFRA